MTPQEIISDAEITRVHGYANFGDMTPREVVNDGVRKYAVGFTGGHTQLCILLYHGLIQKPKPGKYRADLTEKGKRYARAIFDTHFCRARAPDPKVQSLVEAAKQMRDAFIPWEAHEFAAVNALDAALAAWGGKSP